MSEPLVSVIVPVYNVEEYLPQCLESILFQTYKELEIILVNDGSTDNSYNICKKYAQKDKRIKVFSQNNQGPGVARNLGLSKSKGEWVSFVDSDDILEKTFYEQLLSHRYEADVICSGIKVLFNIKNERSEAEENFYSLNLKGKVKINYELKTRINTELWNKIFNRNIFIKYNLTYKDGAFEDGDILFKILAVTNYIFVDNAVNYLYRRRSDSLVEQLSRGYINKKYNMIEGSVDELISLYNFFKNNNILEDNWKFLLFLLHRNYYFVSSQISVMQKDYLEKLLSNFLEQYVSNEIINQYGIDIDLLYRLKNINVFTPFHSENINNSVKIAVCYHKPSLLPDTKNKVFFPIHLGRAIIGNSKDGEFNKDDIDWLYQNMIGDDTGNNISNKNRQYCELTAIYWAWKNYDKIGNPKYFGICHYRRIFNLYNQIIDADCYIAPLWQAPERAKQQYENFHKTNELDLALEVITSYYPEYIEPTIEYYNDNQLHLFNMFIMKKDIFFHYAEWLFDVLSKIEQKMEYKYKSYQALRGIAYVAERLQDIYILKLKKDGYKIKEMPLLLPQENTLSLKPSIKASNNTKVIVTSCDDNYILYAGTMIKSVISNILPSDKYSLYILDGGVSDDHKKKIKKLESNNITIEFVNMNYYISRYKRLFKVNTHFSPATYFRFFIPEIFSNFKKILYLDPDMIINHNIEELFNINLDNKILAACRDVEAERKTLETTELQEYFYNKLKIKNIHNYFQAGVMLCNIEEMTNIGFTDSCLTMLEHVETPMWVDQDIMNSVIQDKVYFLEPKWNYGFFLLLNNSYILNALDYRIYDLMKKVEQNPYIIHFCGEPKPWSNPKLPFAEFFWHYARQTPFYEEILYNNLKVNQVQNVTQQIAQVGIIRNIANYSKNRFNYYRCKLLSNLTFGSMRRHYKDKKKKLKAKIKEVRRFLKGK